MKNIELNTFYDYKFLSNLNVNESMTKAGFIVTTIDEKKNTYKKDFYLTDGKKHKLFKKDVADYYFIKDNTLWLLDQKATKTQNLKGYEYTKYLVYDLAKNKQTGYVELPLSVSKIQVINKELLLVYANTKLDHPDYYLYNKNKKETVIKQRKQEEDYQVIDEYPFFFNGQGFINKTRNRLFIYNLKNKKLQRITSTNMDAESVSVCYPYIAYAGFDFKEFKDKWANIYQYNIESLKTDCLYNKKDFQTQKVLHVNDKLYVVGTFAKEYGHMENSKFYTVKNNTLTFKIDNDTSLYPSVGSDVRYGKLKSQLIVDKVNYLLTTVGGSVKVIKVNKDNLDDVVVLDGTIDDFVKINNKWLFIGMFNMNLQELYTFDNKLECVSTFNKSIVDTYYVAKPEPIKFNNDGYELEGWVLLPKGYNAKKQYPSVLDIHGGPKTAYGPIYYHEMQHWVSNGYVVYYCNPRGSDGYGNEFADLRRNMGKIDYSDLMKFTDTIVAKYNLDKDRMVVTGGSYGGYMTNWIVTQTNRFKCGISQRSISNWISMVCASDYGIDFPIEQEFDDLYSCQEELWDCSPLKYAMNIKTPTMFIHSFEDYRCPLTEAYQLYTTMKCRGIDTRICGFIGENHELSRGGAPLHRSRRLKEIFDWMIKYTGGKQ